MLEHVLAEAAFEVERRSAVNLEAANQELRRKESEIAAKAEASLSLIKHEMEQEALRHVELKRRELESVMLQNGLMAEQRMNQELDTKMKESDSLHKAQIERIQQEHLRYKD